CCSHGKAAAASVTSTLPLHDALPIFNDAPVAANDTASMTEDQTTVTGNVLTNDTDVDDGATLTVNSVGSFAGTYGTLQLAANGSYTYTTHPASGHQPPQYAAFTYSID